MTQTTLAGFARSINPAVDIITAYSSAPYSPAPTPEPAPWVVIGSFTVPAAVTGRMNVLGLCQGTAVCSVALYDPVLAVTVTVSSGVEGSSLSPVVTLVAGKVYQVAVKFEGAAEPANVAVVRTVTIVP
jgi:hypothetical protein